MKAKPMRHFLWKWLLLAGVIVTVCFAIGCARQGVSIFFVVNFSQPERAKAMTDSELEQRATCEYWDVCLYEKYEELGAFGPNLFYAERFKYIPKNRYRFGDYERLQSFSHAPQQ